MKASTQPPIFKCPALATVGPGAFLLVASGLSSVLAFGFSVVAARLLAPAQYAGFMALFGLWSLIAMATTTLQLVTARHLAAPSGGTGFRRQLTRWLVAALVLVSLLLSAVVWLVARSLGLGVWVAVSVALQALWLGAFVALLRGRAQAQERFVRFGLSDLVMTALRLAVLGALLVSTDLSPAWVLFVSLGVGSVAVAAVLPPTLLTRDSAPLEPHTLAVSVGSSLLVALALGTLTNVDLLWAHYALSETEAGLFAAGTLASRPFILLGAVAGTVLLPRVASGKTGRTELLKTAGFLVGGTLALAGLAHVLAAPLVTLLFGEPYRAAVGVARAAAWGGALFAPLIMLANATLGLGRTFTAAGFAVFTTLVTVAVFAFAHSAAAYWLVCSAAAASYLVVSLVRLGRR